MCENMYCDYITLLPCTYLPCPSYFMSTMTRVKHSPPTPALPYHYTHCDWLFSQILSCDWWGVL